MSTAWARFLDEQGAQRDAQGVALHLGTAPERAEGDRLFACDHLAVISVRGPDSETFLQGQLTADIREVSQGLSRLAMHLSLKGRGMVSMRLLPAAEGFDILVPRTMANTLLERLQKYILFSKAEMQADDQRVVLGLTGGHANEALTAANLPVPENGDGCLLHNDITLVNAGLDARHLLLLPAEQAIKLWPTLAQHQQCGAALHAQLADISAGEAHVLPGSEDLFLPQVLNYDLLHGVSFNKGCYVGQEVVARMHFKGKLKQRMQRHRWQGNHNPAPGSALRNNDGKPIGEVVASVPHGNQTEALVVIRLDHEGGYGAEIGGELVGMEVERIPLPYE